MKNTTDFYPIVLAGGRGTRFWPLSRRKRAKQLLALDGKDSMLQQTVARLLPLASPKNFWIVTNGDLRPAITRQVPNLPAKQILAEPVGRNTAPAIGLAAYLLMRQNPDAILGLFPSDQVIANEKVFRDTLKNGIAIAAAGENIVVLGVRPTRPETGYGYIEVGAPASQALRVRRFTEKPVAARATEFLEAGNYLWNSGMFLWSAKTLVHALEEHLPKTAKILAQIASTYGTRKFDSTFKRLYPKCENISVDYAILEPRSAKGETASNIFCVPAAFGWNDLGSWTALYEHHSAKKVAKKGKEGDNHVVADHTFSLDSSGNYIHAPGKFVAVVGVTGLVVVETADALLVTTLEHAQDVGKIVKYLDKKKLHSLT
jgi:mannose-1-phosphate guanylyltransferase